MMGEEKAGEGKPKIREMLTRERVKCEKCGEQYEPSEGHHCSSK